MRFAISLEQERFTMMNRKLNELSHKYDKYIYRKL